MYGPRRFAKASLLFYKPLAPPASQQAASHPGVKAPDMIENAHDAGFAMRRHRHRMESMLVKTLQFSHFAHHVIRQALGDKIRNDHRISIKPFPSLHPFNDGAKTTGDIRAAAKTLA